MTTISSAIDDLQQETSDKSVLRIMDPKAGDLKTVWSADNADEVELVRGQFDSAKKRGLVPYKVDRKGGRAEVMREFDPAAEAIIFAPPVAGG